MKVAIIASNVVKLDQYTKKGTEIAAYTLIKSLHKYKKNIAVTAFASGNSKLPVKIESTGYLPSQDDRNIGLGDHVFFELALISKAVSLQDNYDLLHFNVGNGEYVLPFAASIKKPVLITLHGPLTHRFVKKYYSLYKNLSHVYFVSISDTQRTPLPQLNYIKTIYHGVDIKHTFRFNANGGNSIMWTGRASPDKGLDIVLSVIKKLGKRQLKIFPIIKKDYLEWLHNNVIKRRNLINEIIRIYIDFDVHRSQLAKHYQTAKLSLFPFHWEEPFGLVMIESLATGTPVIAFARGAVPEVIKDGETGFIVNPSDKDIRGNFIVKKTGIDGLCEAVEKIYGLNEKQYQKMRLVCRRYVEQNFSTSKMADEYEKVYKEILQKHS